MQITDFRITRFQFARDRVIGDSQVRADDVNVAALELLDDQGNVGLGFVQSLFYPLPAEDELPPRQMRRWRLRRRWRMPRRHEWD